MFSPGCVSPSSVTGFNPVLGSNNSNYTTKVNFNGRTYDAKLLAGTLKGHHYDFKTQESSGLFFKAYLSKNNEKFLENVEEIDRIVRDILKNPKIQGKLKSEGLTLTKTEDLSLTGVFKGSIGYLDGNGEEKRLTVEEISQKVKEEGGNDLGALYSQAYKTMVMSMVDFAGKWISSEEGKTQLTHTPPSTSGFLIKESLSSNSHMPKVETPPSTVESVMQTLFANTDINKPVDTFSFQKQMEGMITGKRKIDAKSILIESYKETLNHRDHVSYWSILEVLHNLADTHELSTDFFDSKEVNQISAYQKDPATFFGESLKGLSTENRRKWIGDFGHFSNKLLKKKNIHHFLCKNIPSILLDKDGYKDFRRENLLGIRHFNTSLYTRKSIEDSYKKCNQESQLTFKTCFIEMFEKESPLFTKKLLIAEGDVKDSIFKEFVTFALKNVVTKELGEEDLSDISDLFMLEWKVDKDDFIGEINLDDNLSEKVDARINEFFSRCLNGVDGTEKQVVFNLFKSYLLAQIQVYIEGQIEDPSDINSIDDVNKYIKFTNLISTQDPSNIIYKGEMDALAKLKENEGKKESEVTKGLFFARKLVKEAVSKVNSGDITDMGKLLKALVRKQEEEKRTPQFEYIVWNSVETLLQVLIASKPNQNEKLDELLEKVSQKVSHRAYLGGDTEVDGASQTVIDHLFKGFSDSSVQLEDSVDLGGHGHTKLHSVTIGQKEHHVFLKKFDQIEGRNYQKLIQLKSPLLEHMPKIYGEITHDGTKYLVMENLKPEGITQLADIKLAGKLSEDDGFNPIACRGELRATGKNKSDFKHFIMKKGADSAPEYMIARDGRLRKLSRQSNYKHSKEYLKESVEEARYEEIEKLQKQLDELYRKIESSSISFIGVSLVLLKNQQNEFEFKLIDPAHIVLDNRSEEKGFYSDHQDFEKYKESNLNALKHMREDLEAFKSPALV